MKKISVKQEIEQTLKVKLRVWNAGATDIEDGDHAYQCMHEEIVGCGTRLPNIGSIALWRLDRHIYAQEDCMTFIFVIKQN